jgi:copper chaperone CopZ
MRGGIFMEKVIKIEGMSCGHCSAHVKEALEGLRGVMDAQVNLAAKEAIIQLSSEVDNKTIKDAIEDAGYEVVEIK